MHRSSLQFTRWIPTHTRPRSRSLNAAHRGRDTLNRRQSNMRPVAASQNSSVAVGRDEKSGGANRRRSERFHVSNFNLQGDGARSTRYREDDDEESRLAGSHASSASWKERPWHVQRWSYFLAKSQSRQRRYCHVRVMNPDGETERSGNIYDSVVTLSNTRLRKRRTRNIDAVIFLLVSMRD